MMSYWDSWLFQEIFNIQSSVEVTSFLFNIVSFVRNACPIYLHLLYLRSSKCFSKTTSLLKADITQKEPTTSVYKIEFQSFKETEKKINSSSKRICSRSISYVSIINSILLNWSFKIRKIYLTKKIFSQGFTETW